MVVQGLFMDNDDPDVIAEAVSKRGLYILLGTSYYPEDTDEWLRLSQQNHGRYPISLAADNHNLYVLLGGETHRRRKTRGEAFA